MDGLECALRADAENPTRALPLTALGVRFVSERGATGATGEDAAAAVAARRLRRGVRRDDAGVARRDVGATRECGRVRVAREGGGGDERAV